MSCFKSLPDDNIQLVLSFLQPRVVFSQMTTVSKRMKEIIAKPTFSFFLFARLWKQDPLEPFNAVDLKDKRIPDMKTILRLCNQPVSGKKKDLLKNLVHILLRIKANPKSSNSISLRHKLIRAYIRLKLSQQCDHCHLKVKPRNFSNFHRLFLCNECRFQQKPLKLCTSYHALLYYGLLVDDVANRGYTVRRVQDMDFKERTLESTYFMKYEDVLLAANQKWGTSTGRRTREQVIQLKSYAQRNNLLTNDVLATCQYNEGSESISLHSTRQDDLTQA